MRLSASVDCYSTDGSTVVCMMTGVGCDVWYSEMRRHWTSSCLLSVLNNNMMIGTLAVDGWAVTFSAGHPSCTTCNSYRVCCSVDSGWGTAWKYVAGAASCWIIPAVSGCIYWGRVTALSCECQSRLILCTRPLWCRLVQGCCCCCYWWWWWIWWWWC